MVIKWGELSNEHGDLTPNIKNYETNQSNHKDKKVIQWSLSKPPNHWVSFIELDKYSNMTNFNPNLEILTQSPWKQN